MARTVTVELGGNKWLMPATYRASKEIAEEVDDPLQLVLKVEREELDFTTDLIVNLIYIGCKHAGCSLDKDQVGDAIFESESGLSGYLETAGNYIKALTLGGPERPVPAKAKKKRPRGSKS